MGLLTYKQACQNFLLVPLYSSRDILHIFTQSNNPVLPEQVSVPSLYSILWPRTNINLLNYYLHLSSVKQHNMFELPVAELLKYMLLFSMYPKFQLLHPVLNFSGWCCHQMKRNRAPLLYSPTVLAGFLQRFWWMPRTQCWSCNKSVFSVNAWIKQCIQKRKY
jgi:hypothetical protein